MKILCVNQKLLKITFVFYSLPLHKVLLTIKPAYEILAFDHCNEPGSLFYICPLNLRLSLILRMVVKR